MVAGGEMLLARRRSRGAADVRCAHPCRRPPWRAGRAGGAAAARKVQLPRPRPPVPAPRRRPPPPRRAGRRARAPRRRLPKTAPAAGRGTRAPGMEVEEAGVAAKAVSRGRQGHDAAACKQAA
jgi:hypothetical protein